MTRQSHWQTTACFLLVRAAVMFSAGAASTPPVVLHVSPEGKDTNSGASNASALASCAGAVRAISALANGSSVPPGGVVVQFWPGTYPLLSNTTCGTLEFKGTEESPLVFRGVDDPSRVVFDGGQHLDSTGLAAVTNTTVLPLLNPAAKGKIKVLHIPGGNGTWGGGDLSWNGVPLTSSRWPNTGLGYVQKVLDPGAVYASDRAKGPRPHCQVCQGDNKSTSAAPCGANISLLQQPTGDWQAEISAGPGFGHLTLSGYLAADWYHERHTIARVDQNSTNTSLQFASYSRYGVCEEMPPPAPPPPKCPSRAPAQRKKCIECIGDCRSQCAAKGCCFSDAVLTSRCYDRPPPPPAPKSGCAGSAPGRFVVNGLLSEVDSPGKPLPCRHIDI